MITYASFCYIIVLCYHRIYDILYSYTTYDGCRSRSRSLLSPLSGMHSGLDSSRICCTIASDNLTLHCRLHSTAYSSILHCWLLPNAALCCVSAAVLYGPVLPVLTAQSVGLRIRVGKLHVKNQHRCSHHRLHCLPHTIPLLPNFARQILRAPPPRQIWFACAQVFGPSCTSSKPQADANEKKSAS
jgi:hypothetical protein